MICAGVDAGSRMIKIVLIEHESGKVVASGILEQGVDQDALASSLLAQVLKRAGIARKQIRRIVATGYGRNAVRFADTTITEITCHARGVRRVTPGARTVIDIGGQDSKLIRLDEDGAVRDFAMNDRCAAGTGRFLEVVASRLQVDTCALGRMAARAAAPSLISSMCVVFAETEIIGLLASGARTEDIVAGVQAAIARRIASMAGRDLMDSVVFTGGVALISGMAHALRTALGRPVAVSPDPQMTGALGAAILAGERR